ncbi:MAG: zinc-ribbon domain-containing protein [Gallionella sp.]
MALIICTECSKQISDQAKSCPQCGAIKFKPKPTSEPAIRYAWIAIIFTFVLVIIFSNKENPSQTGSAAIQTPEQIAAKSKRDSQLKTGALGALTLKKHMKDPEAFNLTAANVKDNGATCYQYRAKNSFGAIFPGSAVLTSKGDLYLSEQGKKFIDAWNQECANKTGDDIKSLAHQIGVL